MTHTISKEYALESYTSATKSKFLTPFQRKMLLKNLQANLQPEYRRRLEIILLADQGKSQTQICQLLGCSQEMARHWIAVAQAGLAHKWNEQPIGRPKVVNDQYIHRLKEIVSHSPREYGYGFRRWTAEWLSKHLAKELGIEISKRHIYRLLKQMGLSTKLHQFSKKQIDDNKNSGIRIYDLQSNLEPTLILSFNLIQIKD